MCTDCDYCGKIRIVKDDGAGGKICASCKRAVDKTIADILAGPLNKKGNTK